MLSHCTGQAVSYCLADRLQAAVEKLLPQRNAAALPKGGIESLAVLYLFFKMVFRKEFIESGIWLYNR